ncbi:MAG: mandelate racemase/muconate lactonizing enzyme family protein [Chloroflexi bacterium]|nr:mandelate racemase/muconate lactonizing enzyme family protein [Chloroflexota bacterium]
MKIRDIETFVVDAGWRPWIFVKVEADDGTIGYSECSYSRAPRGVVGAIDDMKELLIGTDPRAFEMRYWDMFRRMRMSPHGIASMAMAGVENALLDLKAKALGISVVELLGGPLRDSVRVYWSHCGSTRALYPDLFGTPPIRTLDDIAALGREVVERGFTALKTNILVPGDLAEVNYIGFGSGPGTTDQNAERRMLDDAEALISTFRDAVGPDIDICLDLNFNFKPEAAARIARMLEPYNLLWLEMDMYDADALRQVKDGTDVTIASGETLFSAKQYLPYFQARSADVFIIDVPWNGLAQSKKIGDMAHVFELNVAPHNFYSHLASYISATMCAVLPNIRIMEIDIDDVSWKDDLVTKTPEITNGHMKTPTGLGWGTDLNEDIAREHPWAQSGVSW